MDRLIDECKMIIVHGFVLNVTQLSIGFKLHIFFLYHLIFDIHPVCLQCFVAQPLPKYQLIKKLMKCAFLIFRFWGLHLIITES